MAPLRASLASFFITAASVCAAPPATLPAPPVPADDRLVVELVAAEPQIVTPTGIAVDAAGRVFVIENNTHFRPKDYKGAPGDRILILDNLAADGRAERITTFAEGIKDSSMSLAFSPKGELHLVTRNGVHVLYDRDNDGKCDEQKTLVKLETDADYPHNGLNGITFSPDGREMYFCLGLNMGKAYTVVGADGTRVAGGGEGGSIWRAKPDGAKPVRMATGFWNCHDLTFDAFGRLFAIDNDPDDRPPSRLLDIIEGGDYGWQYRNGRKGIHPFTAWNGELPGTLPMVSPTAEAPSGILAYESDGLPDEYRGELLVTGWGDHVVQRFKLEPKGASFTSKPVTMIQGGDQFRPVGIAQGPDGAVYISDWVDKSYTLHGKGRVWRVRMKERPKRENFSAAKMAGLSAEEIGKLLSDPRREVRKAAGDALLKLDFKDWTVRMGVANARNGGLDNRALFQIIWAYASLWEKGEPGTAKEILSWDSMPPAVQPELFRTTRRLGRKFDSLTPVERQYEPALLRELLLSEQFNPRSASSWILTGPKGSASDPFLLSAEVTALARAQLEPGSMSGGGDRNVIDILVARRSGQADAINVFIPWLKEADPASRRLLLQWIGEERLKQYADRLPDALKAKPVTREVLEAYLAAKEKLATEPPSPGKAPAERSGRQFAMEFLLDDSQDAANRAIALQLIDPADAALPADRLVKLIAPLGIEAVKGLALRNDAESQAALREIAADGKRGEDWRHDAVAGLARSANTSAESKRALLDVMHHAHGELRTEALRSLRGQLGKADAQQILAGIRSAVNKPQIATPANKREWAEQALLAFKGIDGAFTEAEWAELTALAGDRPKDAAGWVALLASELPGDAEAGRRVFAHAKSANCAACHTINNRGGAVGPELSSIGTAMSREKLIESVVAPSKDIAPLYVALVIETKDGQTVTGIPVDNGGVNRVDLRDAAGKITKVNADQIVSRRAEKISVMPEGLLDGMTVREVRDLVAFLAAGK